MKMDSKRKIEVALHLVERSNDLLEVEIYLSSRVQRNKLAGLYKEFDALGPAFPQKKGNSQLAVKLQKKVSSTCPACVTPYNMKIYIESAIKYINEYTAILESMVEQLQNPPTSVHNLRPRK